MVEAFFFYFSYQSLALLVRVWARLLQLKTLLFEEKIINCKAVTILTL